MSVCVLAVAVLFLKAHGSSVFIRGNSDPHAQRNSLHASLNRRELKIAFPPSLVIFKCRQHDIDYFPRCDDTDVKAGVSGAAFLPVDVICIPHRCLRV